MKGKFRYLGYLVPGDKGFISGVEQPEQLSSPAYGVFVQWDHWANEIRLLQQVIKRNHLHTSVAHAQRCRWHIRDNDLHAQLQGLLGDVGSNVSQTTNDAISLAPDLEMIQVSQVALMHIGPIPLGQGLHLWC